MEKMSVFIETQGCQMNEYDSDRILNSLSAKLVENPMDADVVIVNTCAIREKADHKAVSALGRYKNLKKSNPDLIIGMAGCVAQLYGDKLIKDIPYLDFVVGPRGIPKLEGLIQQIRNTNKRKIIETSMDIEDVFEISPYHQEGKVTGFVSIQQGCNKRCAYCIVPTVRGKEINRPLDRILEESKLLINQGAKELTYIGQTVNSWKHNGDKFYNLLDSLQDLEGLERIRFTTSFPRDITPKMINSMKRNSKICRQLHLPVQSGSNKVLKSMNRTYSIEWYKECILKLKEAMPDLSLSTDIIVGFSDEDENDFEKTMQLIEDVRFDTVYSFKYSIRPGTPGERIKTHVSDEIAKDRLQRLQLRQREITLENNKKDISKTFPILIEGNSKNNPSDLFGRTTQNKVVNIKNLQSEFIGQIVNVQIQEAHQNSLVGNLT
tara:strand:+ start:4137 stop:5441 length:1305 start_codon:yes stop_codon:yes gene_type:complete